MSRDKRLNRIQEVDGSSPFSSTNEIKYLAPQPHQPKGANATLSATLSFLSCDPRRSAAACSRQLFCLRLHSKDDASKRRNGMARRLHPGALAAFRAVRPWVARILPGTPMFQGLF